MSFNFVDLFAGIGGFHYGLHNAGGNCVFASEWNIAARETYQKNFITISPQLFIEGNYGKDITKISASDIPPHDILAAGFPCQPFSSAGKQLGFSDVRGTLFFDIMRIADYHQTKILLLENVKNLTHHDGGKTFATIVQTLKDANYQVSFQVLNAKDFGVPQSRERTIIVATRQPLPKFEFGVLDKKPSGKISDVLDQNISRIVLNPNEYTLLPSNVVKKQSSGLIFVGYRNKNMRANGVRPDTEHLSRAHRQPNRIYSSDGIHPTLSSQESAGRYFVLDKGKVIKLDIKDCYQLMGFPESHQLVGSLGNQYKQVGNAVCVPMVEQIAEHLNIMLKTG